MLVVASGPPHKEKKILGDRSNTMVEDGRNAATQKDIIAEPENSPKKMSENGSIENSLPDFEHFRARLSSGLIQHILSETHHQTDSLDELVEDIYDSAKHNIYLGDKVRWKKDPDHSFTVYFSEKRGGTRMLKLKSEEGKENGDMINQNDVKRTEKVLEEDVRDLISTAATKTSSGHWVVTKPLCDEYKLKDKIASIFLSRTPGKKFSLTAHQSASSEDDEDDRPLAELPIVRRSSIGIAPSSKIKNTTVTPKAGNDKKVNKKELKQKENAEKKEKKEAEKKEKKDAEKLAKKEAKEKEKIQKQKEKEEKKVQKGAMNKFVISGTKGSSDGSSTPFLTPAKRAEKKFETMLAKLRKEFNSGHKDAFNTLCHSAGKDLKIEQIESIPEELIKFSVKKSFDREKDREMMKNMSAEDKTAYKKQINTERKDMEKLNIQLKNYFEESSQREDLLVCASDLPLFGVELEENTAFGNCLVLTQAIFSLAKFLDHNFKIGAEQLYESLTRGRDGYVHGLGQILEVLIGLLQQDSDFKIIHCGQRVRHFTTDLQAVSDMCRSILMGVTELPRERKPEKSEETMEDEATEDEDLDESGDADQLERTQIEEQHISTLLERFSVELELWQLNVVDQMDIAMIVLQYVLDSQLYADYLQGGATEKEHEIGARIEKEKHTIENCEADLKEIPAIPDDVDESTMSRIESRVIEKNRMRRIEIERKMQLCTEIIEDQHEKLDLERSFRKNALRQIPVGMDRHFRHYWFFGKFAPNRGLWIQDLGTTNSELAIKASERAMNGEETEEEDVQGLPSTSEKWSCVRDLAEVDRLIKSLNEVGSREKALKGTLVKLKHLMAEQKNLPTRSISPKEDEPVDSLSALKESIRQFSEELLEKRMSCIKDSEDFENRLVSTEDVKTAGSLIAELVESIQPSAIKQRTRLASTSAIYTLEKWLPQVHAAANCSHLFMLLDMVQSRIDWGKSVNNKRCKKCGKRGMSDVKLVCASCSTCYHIHCLRPKLTEIPEGEWKCTDCEPTHEEKTKKNSKSDRNARVNYVEESDQNEDEEEEPNDDFFTARRRSTRKRVVVDSDMEENADESTLRPNRAKRGRVMDDDTPVTEECRDILKKIQSTRIYQSLSNVPSQRSSRHHKEALNIKQLEENVTSFKSIEEFKNKLNAFCEVALHHFQEMSWDRKVEQLEEVMKDVGLLG